MGNVQAREARGGTDHGGDDGGGVDFGSMGARVTKVHLKGLQRTKDDMVVASIEPVLKVKQVGQTLTLTKADQAGCVNFCL